MDAIFAENMDQEMQRRLEPCLDEIVSQAPDVDRGGEFPAKNFELLHEHDVLNITAASEHGGLDAGITSNRAYYAATAQLGAACSSTAQCFSTHSIALAITRVLGTAEQHERYARAVADGAIFGYYGSEPDQEFDSDSGDRVRYNAEARQVDDGWIIDADKFFATNSTHADYHMLHVMEAGSEDMTGLLPVIVPAGADGVTIEDTWDGMGQRATASGIAKFDGVHISDENVIGEPGDLIEHGLIGFNFQLLFAAIFVGLAKGAFEFTTWYLENESKPPSDLESLAHDPHVQLHVGEMDIDIRAAWELVDRAAQLLDETEGGANAEALSNMGTAVYRAKVKSSEVSIDVANRLFQICGARSTSRQFDADRFWRNARTLTLHDILDKQKTSVAKDALGIEEQQASTR
ncbi:acyl-CoA dehydrogenase family protein [Natrinema halophilum]|uniref:acyl-CoA dehydrogenase family protein n=1 Tax=Natrinema halophilum TaxID=1699371 RepID=UPI001F293847|nr:acyl-CoA dehydrogenase family protein [Natrinema halophilum]UHQ96304.1 acyl-CoA dehydrogenase family protein [Natrinema halophilum]